MFLRNKLKLIRSWLRKDPLMKIVRGRVIELPTPARIRTLWNFGSLLGLCLATQILSGLFLAIHYTRNTDIAFFSVRHIIRDVNYGWLIRIIHSNGARMFFIALYTHIGRGLYYSSFKLYHTWIIGVTILLLVIATAFLGYVLPWGQISFWGATVITNLFSAIPVYGSDIVYWLWGGFAVSNPTLRRFFALHFILPFLISAIVLVHLLFLHQNGSNNPLGVSRNFDKVSFHPYFSWKDILGFWVFILIFISLVLLFPWFLGDTENFIMANPLVTPLHIQPEWYFLFAYAILRSIPNKLGGVIALAGAVLVFYLMPLSTKNHGKRNIFQPLRKIIFWWFIIVVIILTWVGARPVETPYVFIGQILTLVYFVIIIAWINLT